MMGKAGWEVQNSAMVVGTLFPAAITASDQRFVKPAFPSHLKNVGPMNKSRRVLQELHGKVKRATTTSHRAIVTAGYLDLLHRRLLRPLQIGAVKDCAMGLLDYGLGREFFAEQSPALRDPLKIEDQYRKLEGKVRSALAQEIQALDQAAQAQKISQVKRKRPAASSSQLPDGGADEAEDNGDPAAKRNRVAAKAKAKPKGYADTSKSTLGSWKVAKQVSGADGDDAADSQGSRKPILILRFIEGHTNAVRRQIHIGDMLGPWTGF
jgi:type II secretory pathway pseudopilin PulG